jgi:hypothetical protein
MIEAPLLHALDMRVAFEVIEVVGFLQPASLTLGFADLTAFGLRTVELPPNIAVVGMKEVFTVQTFTLSSWRCHRSESPQLYDAKMAVRKEENRTDNRDEEKQ